MAHESAHSHGGIVDHHVDDSNDASDDNCAVDNSSISATCPDESTPLIGSRGRAPANASYRRLLIPFLAYCTAMGAVAVPKLQVIINAICIQYGEKNEGEMGCDTPANQARMAQFLTYANLLSGIGCAISGPKIGKMADRYGRKPFLAFTAFGLLFGDVVSIVAIYFPRRIPVYWILLEFGVGGLTGTFAATMAVIQAYAADGVEGQDRASAFSRIHACQFLGVALGPSFGEFSVQLVGGGNILIVFYAALVCHAAFIAFVLFGIEESLKTPNCSNLRPSEPLPRSYLEKLNIFGSLKILRAPPHATPYTAKTNLLVLAFIDAIAFGVQLGLATLLVLYAEHQLGWDRMEANLFISVTNATRAIALVIVLPGLYRIFPPAVETSSECSTGASISNASLDIAVIRIALLFDMLSHVGFALSGGSVMFTISGVIAAAGVLASPVIQSTMTNCVETERVGELLGAVTLIHAAAKSIIPAGIQLIYSLSLSRAPPTIFGVLALVFAATLGMSLFIRR